MITILVLINYLVASTNFNNNVSATKFLSETFQTDHPLIETLIFAYNLDRPSIEKFLLTLKDNLPSEIDIPTAFSYMFFFYPHTTAKLIKNQTEDYQMAIFLSKFADYFDQHEPNLTISQLLTVISLPRINHQNLKTSTRTLNDILVNKLGHSFSLNIHSFMKIFNEETANYPELRVVVSHLLFFEELDNSLKVIMTGNKQTITEYINTQIDNSSWKNISNFKYPIIYDPKLELYEGKLQDNYALANFIINYTEFYDHQLLKVMFDLLSTSGLENIPLLAAVKHIYNLAHFSKEVLGKDQGLIFLKTLNTENNIFDITSKIETMPDNIKQIVSKISLNQRLNASTIFQIIMRLKNISQIITANELLEINGYKDLQALEKKIFKGKSLNCKNSLQKIIN